jgi:hypothetical protein
LTRRDNQRPKHHLRATPKAAILNPLRHTITIQIDAQFSSSLSRYNIRKILAYLRALLALIIGKRCVSPVVSARGDFGHADLQLSLQEFGNGAPK